MKKRTARKLLIFIIISLLVLSGVLVYAFLNKDGGGIKLGSLFGGDGGSVSGEATDAEVEPTPEPTPDPYAITEFSPTHTDQTKPSKMIKFTNIMVDGKTLSSNKKYKNKNKIEFGVGRDYTDVQGVITFRGNNFRDNPTYGSADMQKYKMKKLWSVPTGSLTIKGQLWSGNGWTGQPLLVRWPASVKKHMNMKKWAKKDDDLVEAIYASLDGNIYFLDIRTGKQTRDTMKTGFVFKGAGALDPRGYPIMYVGSGYDSPGGKSRAFIINLLDCSVMYEYGSIDPFSLRGALSFFDSSSLVDAETDTLIQPGENGILYLIKLNTKYDEEAGTLSINPGKIVKWRYQGKRSGSTFWLGMEDSAAVYKGYLYIADNGGHLMCLDINKLKLVWVQDILDDSNSTPVLSVEDGKLYLYISTSFHKGWRSSNSAEIPIWKIDAENGEIIWQKSYTCHSREGNSGGVQSTIAVGHKSLDKYIYVTVSKTDGLYNGVFVCLKKSNGKVKWEQKGPYTWSSPVCVYNSNEDGRDVVLYARSDSMLMMLDGKSGKTRSKLNLGSGNVEASPAVFEDILVLGTRGCRINGVKLR
ncbi:MAG: PQQ-binding-like beta-propeller repeat protein [Eubacterium sp.]|nr:PQQ-binding-like beta-propeller repeat protein [Eubacterium sp.]